MTFKQAEMKIADLRCDYSEYTDEERKALSLAEEALCILSDVENVIKRYQEEEDLIPTTNSPAEWLNFLQHRRESVEN